MNNLTEVESAFNERSISENIEIAYLVCAIVIGVPLNCWRLIKCRNKWKTRQNKLHRILLVLNLTVSNFLVLLTYCPTQIGWLINVSWPWSELTCKLRMFGSVFVFYLSSNAVVAIAFEMFQTVYWSLNAFKFSDTTRCIIPLIVSWLAAAVCSCGQLFTWGLQQIPYTYKMQCMFLYEGNLSAFIFYQVAHLLILFYLPLCVIILCYVATGFLIVKQLRQRKRLQEKKNILLHRNANSRINNSLSILSSNDDSLARKIKFKFIRRSSIVIITYVICWLPYQALSVWSTLHHYHNSISNNIENHTVEIYGHPLAQYINWLDCLMICSTCINTLFYI